MSEAIAKPGGLAPPHDGIWARERWAGWLAPLGCIHIGHRLEREGHGLRIIRLQHEAAHCICVAVCTHAQLRCEPTDERDAEMPFGIGVCSDARCAGDARPYECTASADVGHDACHLYAVR